MESCGCKQEAESVVIWGGGGDLRAILAQIHSMASSSQQHQRFKAHHWMMQLITTSSRWGAVSSITLLCTPSSCVSCRLWSVVNSQRRSPPQKCGSRRSADEVDHLFLRLSFCCSILQNWPDIVLLFFFPGTRQMHLETKNRSAGSLWELHEKEEEEYTRLVMGERECVCFI